jgi:hypothetical protein
MDCIITTSQVNEDRAERDLHSGLVVCSPKGLVGRFLKAMMDENLALRSEQSGRHMARLRHSLE